MTSTEPPLQRSGRADFEWGMNAIRHFGERRAMDTMALMEQESLADVFDPGWPDEQKIAFVAEMEAGALPPERKQARLMTLPPELATPIAEADAARTEARGAYDTAKALWSERTRRDLSLGGQLQKPFQGFARGVGLGAVGEIAGSKHLQRAFDTGEVALWKESQDFAKTGATPVGPAVRITGLLPEDRLAELYFEGGKAGIAEVTAQAPKATTAGEISEAVGGLAGFVAGPGKLIGAAGKLMAGKAASKGVQLMLGVAGRAVGYAGVQAAMPLPQEDLAYVEEARATGGDEAASKMETNLRALRAIQGAAMWPVMEIVGGATGALGKAIGGGEAGGAVRQAVGKVAGGAATGAGFTAGEAVMDLPVMRAVSEAMVGRDPGVRSAVSKAILHTLDPQGQPGVALAAWKEAGAQLGTGAAVFGAFHALTAFQHGAALPLELQERILAIQGPLAAEARAELRKAGVDPETAARLVEVEGERPERVTVSTGRPESDVKPEESASFEEANQDTPPREAASEQRRQESEQRRNSVGSDAGPTEPEAREETPKERERRGKDTEAAAPTRERLQELRQELDAREERTPEVERAREDMAKAEELLAAGRVGEAERAIEDAEVRAYTGARPEPEPIPTPHEAEVRRVDMEAAIEVKHPEPGKTPERLSITPSKVSEGMLEVETPGGGKALVHSVEEAVAKVQARAPEATVTLRGPLAQEAGAAKEGQAAATTETRARRRAALEAAEPAREQAKQARQAATEERLKAELAKGLREEARQLKTKATKAGGSERAKLVAKGLEKARAKAAPRTKAENKALVKEQAEAIDEALSGQPKLSKRERLIAERKATIDAEREAKRQGEMFGGLPILGVLKNLPDLLMAKQAGVESDATAMLHARRKWGHGFSGIERWAHRWIKEEANRYGEVVAAPKREAILNGIRDLAKVMTPLLDKTTGIGVIRPKTKLSRLFFLWAHSAGKTTEQTAADREAFTKELAKKHPKLDPDTMLATWQRSMKTMRRLILRMHPDVIGKDGFKNQVRTATVSLQNARRALASLDAPLPEDATLAQRQRAVDPYSRNRLTKAIAEYEQRIDDVRAEWGAFKERYGIKGGYVHLAYDMARESDFVKQSEKTWFTKRQAKTVGVQSMKHRATQQGQAGYVEDIVFSMTRYVEPLLWKLHAQRAMARLEPIVEGVMRPVGKPYENSVTGEMVDPLFDVLRVGNEINHGPNGVKIAAMDREGGTVTVRPTSFLDAKGDVVLPEALARRELMRRHGGLKQLVPAGEGKFISEQYDHDLADFMRRNERYVAKTADRMFEGITRHFASHGVMALLSSPVSWANNILASLVTRGAMFGPWHTLLGQGKLARALVGRNREYLKVLKDAAVTSGAEIDKVMGLKSRAQHDRTVMGVISDLLLAPMKAISAGFGISEKYNKMSTALTAYSRARAEGKTYPEAIAYSRLAVSQVDFWYVPTLSPKALTHPGTRVLMALQGAPLRLMNKLSYQWGAARARDAAAGTTFMDYMAGKTNHYNVPFRYAVASAIAVGVAHAFLGTDTRHLFGTKITGVATNLVPGMDEFFAYAEENFGIPRETWFVPGVFGDITGGGFVVDFLDATKTVLTSEEQERFDIYWNRLAPMLIGRLPVQLRSAYHANESPNERNPELRDIHHPDSTNERLNPLAKPTGNVKETVTPATLLRRLILPGTPLEHIALRDLQQRSAKEAKATREESERVNKLATKLRRADLSDETREATTNEYRTLLQDQRRRAPRLSRERIIATTQFTDLERTVLKGSAEAQARNLIRYMGTPEADPGKLPILSRLVFGEDADIKPDTRRQYLEARTKFLEKQAVK